MRNVLKQTDRRGATLILISITMVVLLSMVAFAVDIGYLTVVQTELRASADSAALAGAAFLGYGDTTARQKAQEYAGLNTAGGENVALAAGDVEIGNWDSGTRSFQANGSPRNAVRVTTWRRELPSLFAGVMGVTANDVSATAVAAVNTRDIAFVIDLSGSMNNDTEIWATNAINGAFPGYPTIGSQLMADVFGNFGYGSYPGTLQHVGKGLVAQDDLAYANLTKNGGYLSGSGIPSTYRILTSDNEATRKTKAYKWMIDNQLAQIMPNAKPIPNSTASFAYYSKYFDYILKPRSVSGRGTLPPSQDSYRLSGAGNPYTAAWPSLDSSSYSGYYNKLGYLTYVQFMMDYGWNRNVTGSTKVPLSRVSADCPWTVDVDPTSPGYGLQFPPHEQPTHAVRLAVMAAIDKVAALNSGVSDSVKDHVAIITFDTAAGCIVKFPLSATGCDYTAAKSACRDMQAVADDTSSTASENGIILARQHLDPATNPQARPSATRLIVFLSDGIPNIKQSSNSTISSYISNNPSGDWFSSGSNLYERNAVIMQGSIVKSNGWGLHAVGVGLGADRSMMDRLARMSGTSTVDPNNPNGPRISAYADGNPADYQARLTAIFNDIVGMKAIRLVL
jgi:Flp pilus assembly protein TadG